MARFLRFLNTRFCCCSCCSFSYVRNLNIRHALFTFEPSHFFVSSSPQLPQIWFFVAYLLLFIPQWNWFLQLLFQWNDGKIKQKMKWNPIHGFTWVIHFLVFAHSFFFFCVPAQCTDSISCSVGSCDFYPRLHIWFASGFNGSTPSG